MYYCAIRYHIIEFRCLFRVRSELAERFKKNKPMIEDQDLVKYKVYCYWDKRRTQEAHCYNSSKGSKMLSPLFSPLKPKILTWSSESNPVGHGRCHSDNSSLILHVIINPITQSRCANSGSINHNWNGLLVGNCNVEKKKKKLVQKSAILESYQQFACVGSQMIFGS